MELPTIEGESPVNKTELTSRRFLSTTVNTLRRNLGEPSSKAKYIS